MYVLLEFQNTVRMIAAHDSTLAALSFNATATQLASASERVRSFFLSFSLSHSLSIKLFCISPSADIKNSEYNPNSAYTITAIKEQSLNSWCSKVFKLLKQGTC